MLGWRGTIDKCKCGSTVETFTACVELPVVKNGDLVKCPECEAEGKYVGNGHEAKIEWDEE